MTYARLPILVGLLALLSGACATPVRAQSASAMPSGPELRELAVAVTDTARAAWAIGRIRGLLAASPEPAIESLLRVNLVQALATQHAPGNEIADQVDSMGTVPGGAQAEVQVLLGVTQMLSVRREALDRASTIARRAVRTVPRGPEWDPVRGVALHSLGTVEAQRGQYAAAIEPLEQALAFHADSQGTLFALGHAYEQLGRTDDAIGAYTRSLGVFGGEDLRAQDPLRTLWIKQHGSAAGLDARIEAARARARRQVAIESRRDERVSPEWSLKNFEGTTVASSRFKGQVTVLNFWGSWCGPCRRELPYFQSMVRRFESRGVAFMGMNWERAPDPAERVRLARSFMTDQKYDFPVALDHEQAASRAFGVTGYPTVLVLDRKGKIRFKNVGFHPQIDEIMTEQLELLLAEK